MTSSSSSKYRKLQRGQGEERDARRDVRLHEAEDDRLLCEFESQKRILCVAPGENGLLFTGGEDHNVTAWDTKSGKVGYCIGDAHAARVKGIVVLTKNARAVSDDAPYLVASASSDGIIRVWDVRMAATEKPTPLAEANTKSRLTCLAGSSLKSSKQQKVGNNIKKEQQEQSASAKGV